MLLVAQPPRPGNAVDLPTSHAIAMKPSTHRALGWAFLIWVILVNALYFVQFAPLIRRLIGG